MEMIDYKCQNCSKNIEIDDSLKELSLDKNQDNYDNNINKEEENVNNGN